MDTDEEIRRLEWRTKRIESRFSGMRLELTNRTRLADGTWMVPLTFVDTSMDPVQYAVELRGFGLKVRSHEDGSHYGSFTYTIHIPIEDDVSVVRNCFRFLVLATFLGSSYCLWRHVGV